jgi:hypothetical protein
MTNLAQTNIPTPDPNQTTTYVIDSPVVYFEPGAFAYPSPPPKASRISTPPPMRGNASCHPQPWMTTTT